MRDRKDDDLFLPDRVSDVVFTKTWQQIDPADTAAAEVVEEWVGADVVSRLEVMKFKRDGQLRIDPRLILDAIVVLLLSRRVNAPSHHGRETGRSRPNRANSFSVR